MRQIIAMGGGGFLMEPDNLTLDWYILDQAHKSTLKICFLSTASRDADG
jgi:dipeptidase E